MIADAPEGWRFTALVRGHLKGRLAASGLPGVAGCKAAPPRGLHTVEHVTLGPAMGRPLAQTYRLTVIDAATGATWHQFWERDTVTGGERMTGVHFIGLYRVKR